MEIKNIFQEREIKHLSEEIFSYIASESELTSRSLDWIQTTLHKERFYIAFENAKIAGFIAKDELAENIFELKSVYVVPSYRGDKLSDKLFRQVMKNTSQSYLAATFSSNIMKQLKTYGFKTVTINQLPLRILGKYLLTRNLSSVIKHFFTKKSYLLIKYAHL